MKHYDPEDYGYCPYCMRGGGEHLTSCPEASEDSQHLIGHCILCDNAIYERSDYYNMDGDLFHKECFDEEYLVEA